jgi:hypothetical protein
MEKNDNMQNKSQKNIRITMPQIYFFKKTNWPSTGKPFVLYDKYDVPNDGHLSVCVPC